jgi:LacI family transcriptional regulator
VAAATRADVARRAGVSPALVSYALNGGPRSVSEDATARILDAVRELDYRPNRIARALRASRTQSIGMIMPDYTNPHFAELAQAVEAEAHQNGYMLVIGTADNEPAREKELFRTLVERQMDGLLLISANAFVDEQSFVQANLPVVLLDRAPHHSSASSVVVDNDLGAHLAVEHLLMHRRSRLACIAGPAQFLGVQDRAAGYLKALTAAGLSPARDAIHEQFSHAGGYAAMQALLSGPRPDGVFVMSDVQALGAIRACNEAGLQVGTDIALVSFDGTRAGDFSQPRLTTVDQGVNTIARTTIDLLLGQFSSETSTSHQSVQPTLRIGHSCGC